MQVFNGLKASPLTKIFSPQIQHKLNDKNAGKSVKRDSIVISNEARARLGNWQEKSVAMIESLMEKQQKVQEMKSNLIKHTLEAEEELSTIKEQLGEFDEQIAEIQGQISAIEVQKREREQREKEKEQQATSKTQEKSETIQLTSLLQSVKSLEQISALKQVKVPIENAHRRLKTEMSNDIGRGTFLESKANKIAELAGRMRSLDSAMNVQISKAKESSNEMIREASAEEEQEKLISESLEK